jgi:hypothetical protein
VGHTFYWGKWGKFWPSNVFGRLLEDFSSKFSSNWDGIQNWTEICPLIFVTIGHPTFGCFLEKFSSKFSSNWDGIQIWTENLPLEMYNGPFSLFGDFYEILPLEMRDNWPSNVFGRLLEDLSFIFSSNWDGIQIWTENLPHIFVTIGHPTFGCFLEDFSSKFSSNWDGIQI